MVIVSMAIPVARGSGTRLACAPVSVVANKGRARSNFR
jgi:hypothetical protein